MKTLTVIINLFLFCFCPLFTHAQNEEQKAWLNKKSAERQNIPLAAPNTTIVPKSLLKSTQQDGNEIEIDHGESMEAGGSYSSSGGAYRTPNNSTAKQIIHATNVNIQIPNSLQLTGDGITIFLFDNKRPLNGHQAFGQRVFVPLQDFIAYNSQTGKYDTIKSGIPQCNLHPTLSSGIMASGSSNNAQGTAPGAEIIAHDWDYAQYYLADYAAQGANLACFPYGYVAGWNYYLGTWRWFGQRGQQESYLFGFYTSISKKWDEIIHQAPYLLVIKSAGNDNNEGSDILPGMDYLVWDPSDPANYKGWVNLTFQNGDIIPDGSNGTQSISDIAVSKNVITVGGLKDDGSILEISGRGPTDDLRIKPDLVANGEQVYSTTSASANSYGYSPNGTSFSASSLAGGVALLLEQQTKLYGKTKLLSSTLKALLIHTADDKGPVGPDCIYGWGVANIAKSAEIIESNYQNHRQIHEFTFTSDDQSFLLKVKKNTTSEPLKVTICWNDPAGTPPPISLNPADRMLVNDIDLRVTRTSDNLACMPWKLNPENPIGQAITGDNNVDNVEQVVVNDVSTEEYYIQISPKPGHLSEKQVVSVVISGIDPEAFQSDITLDNLYITNVQAEESQNSISCANVCIEAGGNLTLVAENNIILKTGFKVLPGGKLKVVQGNNYFSVFEREYPSVVFQNNLVWEDRDAALKNSKTVENTSDTANLFKNTDNRAIVFPNPCDGIFTIMLTDPDDTQTIEIFDALGKKCYWKKGGFQAQENIDITNGPDGLYLVKIQTGIKTIMIKQIKRQR
jgi:hypothetical protein